MTVDEANDRVVKPASFDYFYEETLQLVVDTDCLVPAQTLVTV